MNKRQICLLIAALVTLGAMLIVSAALTNQSALAQTPTPTPTYWIDCVAGYYYTDGNGQHGWLDGQISYTSDLTGVINSFDSWNLPTNSAADLRSGGCSNGEYVVIHPLGEGLIQPAKCCDYTGGTACAQFGYEYLAGGINPAIVDGVFNGGHTWDQPGAWWNSHVCVIHYSPPPTLTLADCSGDIVKNTHFVTDDWTKSGATWRWSEYDLAANGSIRKNGTFSSTGTYSVSVLARSQWPNHLYACLGSECTEPITISDGAYQWYSSGISVTTAGAHEVFLYASSGNTGQPVTADQICIHPISTTMLSACGIVQDYHFVSPSSWVGTSATWTAHNWSRTAVGYGNIQQSVSISLTGFYSAVISAKSTLGTVIRFMDNGTQAGFIEIPSGTNNWTTFATSVQLIAGSSTFQVVMDDVLGGMTAIDSICVTPSISASGYGPCGITNADMISSKRFLQDPGFDDGLAAPYVFVSGLSIGFPMGATAGLQTDSAYRLMSGDWNYFDISAILQGYWPSFQGMMRFRDGANNPALGIVPVPLHGGIRTTRLPIGPFNFVYRMNRQYANGRLLVNGNDQCSDGGYGTWIQNSIYFPSSSQINLSADCNGVECVTPVQGAKLSVVDIDDTYVVPGPAIPNCECVGGTMVPPAPVLTGTCINANPQFADTSSWRTVGGARILTSGTGGWARLPGGSFIEQDIPVANAGTTWGNLQTTLVVGMTYVIQTAAHIESATEAGQYSVIMGASSPGQVTANHQIVPPAQYSSLNSDSVTIVAGMAGDGDNPTARLRISNEAGGTVLMDTVCVQPTGTGGGAITNPVPIGSCLGTWTLSSGGTAIGVPIAGNDYVQDAQPSLYGSYFLDVSGEQAQDINTLRVSYNNNGTGNYDNVGVFDVVGYAFAGQISFVVPPGGYYNGALQIVNDDDLLEYTNICLRAASGPTPNPHPPVDPGTLPIPACGSVNSPYTNTAGFYQLAPYAISEEYSGTAPVIIAGLTYNYAIYPLVCTTISIANWQYNAYVAWIDKFNLFATRLSAQLDEIIALLEAILAAIPDMIVPPTCGILDVILWLLKTFLTLFLKFMKLFAQGIDLVISIFKDMMLEIRGDSAVQYPFSCSGDGYWLCFALAGILSVQNQVGDWFNIIALIVCSMLTVSLVFWTVNQIRAMAQPGTEEGPSE